MPGIMTPVEWNIVDILTGGWVLLHLVLGWQYGAVRQAVGLGSLLGGLACAHTLTPTITPYINEQVGTSFPIGEALAFTGITLTALVFIRVLAYPLRALIESEESFLSSPNRISGAICGVVAAALLAYIALSVSTVANARYGEPLSKLSNDYNTSVAVRFARRYNALEFLRSQDFRILRDLALHESGVEPMPVEPQERKRWNALLAHARFLEQHQTLRALIDQEWSTILDSTEILTFLSDPDVREHLTALSLKRPSS